MTIVYTTIFGGSDSLKPAPVGADRCVLFTDDLGLDDPKGWEVIHRIVEDPRRSAWEFRAQSHLLFPACERVVWIDASFTLTDLPLLLAETATAQIAAMRHHHRSSVYDEGAYIIKIGQGLAEAINPQMDQYRAACFPGTPLSISSLLVRANSYEVKRFNEKWLNEFTTHRGDNTQLSLDYSAWASGLEIQTIRGTYHNSPYFTHDRHDHKLRRRPYAK